MARSQLRHTQLTLLGTLPAAKLEITLHLEDGIPGRQFWISGTDLDGEQVLLWSDSTSEGPRGGLNLADLLTELLEIFRLTRTGGD